ncbi:MAG: YbhB/YbcL family Raf kinase inhibitor-like protein [Archaeoglobaceae archaeon]
MKKVGIIVLLILAVMLCGCNEQQEDTNSFEQVNVDVQLGFESFPQEHTCDGDNISPEIKISGIDMENAESIAVVIEDPDAPQGIFTHWVIWNIEPTDTIPADIPQQAEVNAPISAVQGENSFGNTGYSGPCPPEGEEHTYNVEVFVLSKKLDLPAESTRADFESSLTGYVSQKGDVDVTYSR